MPAPMRLVYSFAPADDTFQQQLSTHLRPLIQQNLLSEWYEQLIPAGATVAQERHRAWSSADIIFVLLSADYFSSSAYDEQELQIALERHRTDQALIIPILIRPCDWQATAVAHLQILPRNGNPVIQWEHSDEALLSIVQELRHLMTLRQSSRIPLTLTQQTSRQRLLKRVRTMWIEGMLEQSLQHAVWIDLHLQKQPDALERSWSLMVQELDRGPRTLPPGTNILQVFDEADEELLILGEPGSGKTTLLLYLAHTLLDHADTDESRRMPVVFNLSSWARQRLPLDQWLIEELKIRYQVPQNMGQAWIAANQIFPLLDGLDEVAEVARVACVQAISAYTQRDLDRTPLVLCCRTEEYQALSLSPPIYYAIVLLPFTDEQMEVYLSSVSGPVDALRQALREDQDLFELARRPLMLSLFTQAYHEEDSVDLSVLQQDYPYALFKHYVEHMLTRRARVQQATEKQMYDGLTYFATQLYRQQQTMFAIEELQPTWLPESARSWYRWSMPIVYAFTFGLIFGPVFGLSFGMVYTLVSGSISGLLHGIVFGLMVGVIGGLIGGLVFGITFKQHQTIQPAEITIWSWASAWQGMQIWTIGGLAVGVAAGVAGAIIIGLAGGVAVGVAAIIVVGLVGGLVGGIPPMQLPEKISFSPNEGIWRSGKRGLLFVLIAILLFGLAGGVIFGLFGTAAIGDLAYGLVFGIILGSVGGLIFGLAFGLIGGRTGLAAFLQHFVLRFFLWRLNLLPWNLVAFLDEATGRLLLRKVGGSYIFVHRLLRDVLATQNIDGQ